MLKSIDFSCFVEVQIMLKRNASIKYGKKNNNHDFEKKRIMRNYFIVVLAMTTLLMWAIWDILFVLITKLNETKEGYHWHQANNIKCTTNTTWHKAKQPYKLTCETYLLYKKSPEFHLKFEHGHESSYYLHHLNSHFETRCSNSIALARLILILACEVWSYLLPRREANMKISID